MGPPSRARRPQGDEVLDPRGSLAAVCEQAMVGHAMPTLMAKYIEEDGQVLPGKKKRAAMAPTWKSPSRLGDQLMRPSWCSRHAGPA
jgi:hypothetical protein